MVRTIIILIAALVALPIIAMQTDQPLSDSQTDLLWRLFQIMLGAAMLCFLVSEITGNYSQVDKLWSILPLVYCWFVAFQTGFPPRITLMAVMVSIWGARLTFNFARRGGYHWIPWQGEQDYRWAVLRQAPHFAKRLNWTLFNLFFISLYQNGLILLFTLPVVMAAIPDAPGLYWADFLCAALMLGFIVLETVADQQQYDFQTEKYRRINAGLSLDGEYAQGFKSTGLWGVVRHPNYASEQMIWIVFYFFSVAATGRWLNWTVAGPILLMLLFLGSSDFSEKISLSKYPAYRDYQQRVSRFWGI